MLHYDDRGSGVDTATLSIENTYNGFGEVTDYGAAFRATALITTAYTRDGLGRITENTEILGGVTSTYAYT